MSIVGNAGQRALVALQSHEVFMQEVLMPRTLKTCPKVLIGHLFPLFITNPKYFPYILCLDCSQAPHQCLLLLQTQNHTKYMDPVFILTSSLAGLRSCIYPLLLTMHSISTNNLIKSKLVLNTCIHSHTFLHIRPLSV